MSLDTAKATVTLRSLTGKFDREVRAYKPFYPEVSNVITSDGADEQYGMLGSLPQMREWLGDRVEHELRAANFIVANKHWESTLRIKKTDIADDRMKMYGMLMPDLGQRAASHPDKLFFETLVAGSSTACLDGQYFFDTDHVFGDSGTQDNDLTSNATDHTAVTLAEFKAAWLACITKLIGYKDDRGEPLNAPTIDRFDSLVVIVPGALRQVAHDAFDSTLISNSTNIVIDKPRVICSPYLTDGATFYVLNTEGFLQPFLFQEREPLQRQYKGLDDLQMKDVLFMTEARYAMAYVAWWKAVRYEFT